MGVFWGAEWGLNLVADKGLGSNVLTHGAAIAHGGGTPVVAYKCWVLAKGPLCKWTK